MHRGHRLGDAAAFRRSEERKAIIDLLRDTEAPMSPNRSPRHWARKAARCVTCARDGQGRRSRRLGGAYRLPVPPANTANTPNNGSRPRVSTVSDVSGTSTCSDRMPNAPHRRTTTPSGTEPINGRRFEHGAHHHPERSRKSRQPPGPRVGSCARPNPIPFVGTIILNIYWCRLLAQYVAAITTTNEEAAQ